MRGTGFTCNQCLATAVPPDEVLPDGWLEVVQRQCNPFGQDYPEGTLHFCGWSCAEHYAELAQPERCDPDCSRSGIDGTDIADPDKVWRCDGCREIGTSAELDESHRRFARSA